MAELLVTGLCGRCRHHAWVLSGRGSRFLLCERHRKDPAFAKYPHLPLTSCDGYEPFPEPDDDGDDDDRDDDEDDNEQT